MRAPCYFSKYTRQTYSSPGTNTPEFPYVSYHPDPLFTHPLYISLSQSPAALFDTKPSLHSISLPPPQTRLYLLKTENLIISAGLSHSDVLKLPVYNSCCPGRPTNDIFHIQMKTCHFWRTIILIFIFSKLMWII